MAIFFLAFRRDKKHSDEIFRITTFARLNAQKKGIEMAAIVDVLKFGMMYYSVSDTDKLGKRKSECSYQESNLRPSDY